MRGPDQSSFTETVTNANGFYSASATCPARGIYEFSLYLTGDRGFLLDARIDVGADEVDIETQDTGRVSGSTSMITECESGQEIRVDYVVDELWTTSNLLNSFSGEQLFTNLSKTL